MFPRENMRLQPITWVASTTSLLSKRKCCFALQDRLLCSRRIQPFRTSCRLFHWKQLLASRTKRTEALSINNSSLTQSTTVAHLPMRWIPWMAEGCLALVASTRRVVPRIANLCIPSRQTRRLEDTAVLALLCLVMEVAMAMNPMVEARLAASSSRHQSILCTCFKRHMSEIWKTRKCLIFACFYVVS